MINKKEMYAYLNGVADGMRTVDEDTKNEVIAVLVKLQAKMERKYRRDAEGQIVKGAGYNNAIKDCVALVQEQIKEYEDDKTH